MHGDQLRGRARVAVPTGVIDGLPSGVRIIGRAFREDLCLAAAQEVEDRLGALTVVDGRYAADRYRRPRLPVCFRAAYRPDTDPRGEDALGGGRATGNVAP
ncbi:hypothetical protein [Micromonospora sp. NPDC049282]|uniref:hypothetical protein n=1 Tax=Micromonospora sp. NPDC049282 TaxID=3364269 RepID=UPI0037214D24